MEILISKLFQENKLVSAVLSGADQDLGFLKVGIRPIDLKGIPHFQFTYHHERKATHKNLPLKEALHETGQLLEKFTKAVFFGIENDFHLIKTKGAWKITQQKPTKKAVSLKHNRDKLHLLPAAGHAAFWQSLGIANASGAIKPDKQSKFRQVNRFIELADDVFAKLPGNLTIVDFGCGKGYLTFALYHYLTVELKRNVKMIGVDLKVDVVKQLDQLRQSLNYDSLSFAVGDIRTYPLPDPVDAIIALHACDTATDAVLQRAIAANAKAIFAVPCCHHALTAKLHSSPLKPLLKHPILKERFAALATDALRALNLELAGYDTQVIEFVETEHTPKNLLIRAIKSERKPDLEQEQAAFLSALFPKGI